MISKAEGFDDGMKFEEKREILAEMNEEAILFDGFEDALIGYVQVFSNPALALYDRAKCIQILMERDGMDEETAVEFFEFNTQGAYVGEFTPAIAVLFSSL